MYRVVYLFHVCDASQSHIKTAFEYLVLFIYLYYAVHCKLFKKTWRNNRPLPSF